MKRIPLSSGILLFTAAVIWGFAFVAQREGMEYLGPFSFNGARYLLGSAVLLPLVLVRKKAARKRGLTRGTRKDTWLGGLCCGLVICSASMFQQLGLLHTTVGKAGFITTLYIILVPLLGIFLKRKVPRIIWVGAMLSAVGMYLLCINEQFTISKGDGLLLICALLFSVHIMVIDYFSPKVDGVELSCLQFLIAGVICFVIGVLREHPQPADFLAGIIPLAYTGILSSGVAYTFQIVGQRDADPAVAALILSLESVISVLAGWMILGQRLSGRELAGCAIVFAAVILVQLPVKQPLR